MLHACLRPPLHHRYAVGMPATLRPSVRVRVWSHRAPPTSMHTCRCARSWQSHHSLLRPEPVIGACRLHVHMRRHVMPHCAVLQPERWRGALHRAAMHLAHAMHKHMHMPCMSSDVIENWKKCEHAGFPFMRIPFTLPHRAG